MIAIHRSHVFSALAIVIVVGLLLFYQLTARSSYQNYWEKDDSIHDISSTMEPDVRAQVSRWEQMCAQENPFEQEYGRVNLRMSRAYEGSQHRLRQFLRKASRKENLVISAIGGSITKGHHVWDNEVWFHKFWEWLDNFLGDVQVTQVNGAAPATGSDYYSYCFPLHIPQDSDLVLVELAVNDEGILEHIENMENLLRGLLDLPNQPAVILVEALAFSNGGMGGGGGRIHLPVAQYYDVPVINSRHPLANHFARFPQLVRPYFAQNFWGDPDTRHVNSRGHRDLGMLVASLFRDVACSMVLEDDFTSPTVFDVQEGLRTGDWSAEAQKAWPSQSRFWREAPKDGEAEGQAMPGMWEMPPEYGMMPRMRVLDGWNPDVTQIIPPFRPTCLSTRSTSDRFNLTPTYNYEWEHWVHPDYLDKPYMVARIPGALISFELDTTVGVIKMYSLRSKTFGLGTVKCWVDDDLDQAVQVVGWWDNGDANIGRFSTIRDDLAPGTHVVTCELLKETSDPGGGREFRMISMMSV